MEYSGSCFKYSIVSSTSSTIHQTLCKNTILNLRLCGTFYLAELRILTIISYSLNLRKTIRLYWSSCKLLRDLIIYMGLMLAILSTFFLQIYMGLLTQACVKDGNVKNSNLFRILKRFILRRQHL